MTPREKKELPGLNQFKENNVHLVYFADGSVSKVANDGEVIFISAMDRVELREKGSNKPEGQDIDYWLQMFCIPDERKGGVYSVSLQDGTFLKLMADILWTRDDETNQFMLSSNGMMDAKIAVSLNVN